MALKKKRGNVLPSSCKERLAERCSSQLHCTSELFHVDMLKYSFTGIRIHAVQTEAYWLLVLESSFALSISSWLHFLSSLSCGWILSSKGQQRVAALLTISHWIMQYKSQILCNLYANLPQLGAAYCELHMCLVWLDIFFSFLLMRCYNLALTNFPTHTTQCLFLGDRLARIFYAAGNSVLMESVCAKGL